MRHLIKTVLKMYGSKKSRELRVVFVGKRLKVRQYKWLYFRDHSEE